MINKKILFFLFFYLKDLISVKYRLWKKRFAKKLLVTNTQTYGKSESKSSSASKNTQKGDNKRREKKEQRGDKRGKHKTVKNHCNNLFL